MAGTFIGMKMESRNVFNFLSKVNKQATPEVLGMTRRLAIKMRDSARSNVGPLGTGTGDLENSIDIKPMGNNQGYWVEVNDSQLKRPYAAAQEAGFTPKIKTTPWGKDYNITLRQIDPRVQKQWAQYGYYFLTKRHAPFLKPAFDMWVRGRHLANEGKETLRRIVAT